MRRLLVGAVVAFCLFAAGICQAASVFVDLKPEASVAQRDIRLADIAHIVSRDSQSLLAERLGNLTVSRCVSLAQKCRLMLAPIVAEVDARASELGISVVWGANQSTVITGRTQSLSLATAVDQGGAWIVGAIAQGNPVLVSVVEGPMTIDVPPGQARLQPGFSQIRRLGDYVDLPIQVLVDGIEVARTSIRYLVRQGNNPGSSGSALAAPVPNPSLAMPSVTEEQKPGTNGLSRTSVAVSKDQRVRLLVESGLVKIETDGIALADAELGESVRVRRTNGLAAVTGRAIDHGTVQLIEN